MAIKCGYLQIAEAEKQQQFEAAMSTDLSAERREDLWQEAQERAVREKEIDEQVVQISILHSPFQLESEPGLARLLDNNGMAPPVPFSPSNAPLSDAQGAVQTEGPVEITPVSSVRKKRKAKTPSSARVSCTLAPST